eukprot:scaffold10570_cov176-Amphora_coffeaeformis.AAC.9
MEDDPCAGHEHDHQHADDLGLSLRTYVDFSAVTCLNEEEHDSGKGVIKPHDERLSAYPNVQSPEDDPELLLFIPFTESVTIQSITIRDATTGNETASPRRIKLFTNRDDIDFEMAREMPAQQQLELLPPDHFAEGTIDYPCRPAGRFQNISSLTIFVQDNYDATGESGTSISYVGLKGKGTRMKRRAVDTVYESQGMIEDHKV